MSVVIESIKTFSWKANSAENLQQWDVDKKREKKNGCWFERDWEAYGLDRSSAAAISKFVFQDN